MRTLVVIGALLLAATNAAAQPRRAGWSIQRSTPAPLGTRARTADVEALLVGSRWFQPNPAKKTSTWEAYTYTFDPQGTVARTGDLVRDPPVLRWKVVRAGARPVVAIGAARLTLAPCARGDASVTLCLFGTPPR